MAYPLPVLTPLTEPYWTSLDAGNLAFQACACGNRWLPPRHACPRCLSNEPKWELASGEGRVVSWVVYHTAHHEAFRDRLPYNVAIVELAEGPRLITNVLAPLEELRVGLPVMLRIEREEGFALARFAPVTPAP